MTTQTTPWLRVAALRLVTVVVAEGPALAQLQAERGGFTLLLNLGVGVQRDAAFEESATGLSGLNLLQVGVEYAPAFTKPNTVHNLGFTFGYQFV